MSYKAKRVDDQWALVKMRNTPSIGFLTTERMVDGDVVVYCTSHQQAIELADAANGGNDV